jgi:hypothetical protein
MRRLRSSDDRALARDVEAGRGNRVVWPVVVLGANCLFAVWLFWSAWASPGSSWIGDPHDPHIMIWGVAWTPHTLTSLPRHLLVTDFIMYPTGANLMWTTSLIFPALVLWPVTALFGPIVGFNVLATGALALSSWVAYLLIRRYASSELVSALAGMLYGFSPYMILQSLGHTHVTIAVFPPLVWLLLDEVLVRRRRHPAVAGAVLGGAGAAQLLTSTEILATTVLVAAMGVALLAVLYRRQVGAVLRRAAIAGSVALLTFLLLAAYPLKALLFGPQRVSGTLQPPNLYVADVLSFIVPPGYRFAGAVQALPLALHLTGNGVETGGAYVGIPGVVILALALLVGWKWEVVRFAGLLTIGVLVLSMGSRLHVAGQVTGVRLPWAAVQRLPLMGSAIPARMSLFAWLGMAVVLGVVGDRLIASGRRGAVAAAVASIFFAVPIFPTPPLLSSPVSAPAFFSNPNDVGRIPNGSVALVTPYSNEESSTAMYWQAIADFRFRMPEGEAYVPGPSLSPPASDIQHDLGELEAGNYPARPPADERERAMANLRRWRVDTIVVGPSPGEARMVAFFTRVTGRQPERTGGVWVWWKVSATG